MRGFGDISTKLDPGRGEEDATGNEDTQVDVPEVELEFAGNADDDVEYRCKRSATTHSSNFLRRALSSSCRC